VVLKDDRRGICRENSVKAEEYDLKDLIERAAGVTGIKSDDIIRYGRRCKTSVDTRGLLCYWATEYLNIRQRELVGLLNITQSPVSMEVARNRIQAEEQKLSFEI
jgi:hypothetical protein